ncbi:hypothetical protein Aduo_005472 [Ancylostoma duodenale]
MDLYNVLLHNTQTGSDPAELLESSAYATPAPHYVTEFGMEYPLSSHINNNTTTTYVYTDNNQYNTYYQYSGNVHSPSQSYLIHGHGSQSPVSVEDDNSTGLGAATRASPATMQQVPYVSALIAALATIQKTAEYGNAPASCL